MIDVEGGAALDVGVERVLGGLRSLSDLTAPLAVSYLERIGRPLADLTLHDGARIVSAGYAAHLAVEGDGAPYGVTSMPVLATLPDLRHGRAPGDLLLRVVKATRRPFPALCAVEPATWEGFVAERTARTARTGSDLGRELVDGLLRFGWILRQVDIHYGLAAERV